MKIFSVVSATTFAAAFSLAAVLSVAMPAGNASAATPDVFATVTQPVGVAATQNEVLVSQPYCVNDSQTGVLSPAQWQILKFDNAVAQTVFAQIPANPDYGVAGKLSNCQETYLAIASGMFGGFPSGHVYATQGGFIYDFDASGNLVTHGANNFLAFIQSLEVPFAHTSLTFDTVGTFGNKLIVLGTNSSNLGEAWTVDSAGNTTKLLTFAGATGGPVCNGPSGVPCFESPDVAPLMGPIGGAFPGFLFAPLPGLSGIAADIGAISPAAVLSGVGGVAVPEAVHFVPSTPCGFNDTANGKTYEFFNANFSKPGSGGALANTIYAYPTSAFAGLTGQLLVTTEGGSPGIVVSTDAKIDFTSFDSTIYNSEGSNFVQCVSICDCQLKKKCEKDDAGGGDDEHNSGNDKPSYKSKWKSSSKKHHSNAAWDQNNNGNGNHTGDDDEADCPDEQSPSDNNH